MIESACEHPTDLFGHEPSKERPQPLSDSSELRRPKQRDPNQLELAIDEHIVTES